MDLLDFVFVTGELGLSSMEQLQLAFKKLSKKNVSAPGSSEESLEECGSSSPQAKAQSYTSSTLFIGQRRSRPFFNRNSVHPTFCRLWLKRGIQSSESQALGHGRYQAA